ncbi:MAG: IclR family transcriptional regulator [Sulfuritalea sp.]|nr:IclR family transcriptional regulator [Sulfuritalea sp.]
MPYEKIETPSATLRALAVMETVARAEGPLALTEIMAATGLPKPTVHRILALLEGAGMLVREPEGKRYGPGPRLSTLALDVVSGAAWRAPRHAILQSVVDTIGETCNLTMLDGTEVVYLDRVEAAWPLRLHFQSGSRIPAHCSASGKLLLAMMPLRTRKRIVDTLPLPAFTANTITDRAALEHAMKRIRKDRVSTDNEEYLAGTVCVAVPVESGQRRVPAALAVHAPATRMSLAQALAHVPALRRAAAQLADTFPEASPPG